MTKTDFKKDIATYTAPRGRFEVVTVPAMQFLMIDGHGDPNTSQEYQNALLTVYPLAYQLKFLSKKELDRDYVVMPLEGLWWSDDMESFTTDLDKSRWLWTAMIMTPQWLTAEHFDIAVVRPHSMRSGWKPSMKQWLYRRCTLVGTTMKARCLPQCTMTSSQRIRSL